MSPDSTVSPGSDSKATETIVQPSGSETASAPPPPPNPSASQTSKSALGKRKKQLLISGVAALVLIFGGSAAAYFGIVLPNTPDRLWKTAMQNTNQGYDELVKYAEESQKNKGGTLDGNFKINAGGVVADGSINSKYYENDSQTKLDIGAAGARVNMELLTKAAANSKNPDIYAKVSGLKGLDQLLGPSAGGIGQQLSGIDSQWFVIDHTLLDQVQSSTTGQQGAAGFTSQDAIDFMKDIGDVTKEYMLTEDPDKAVLIVRNNVGKETVDGRSVYHYAVGFNKNNLKAYNKALCDRLAKSQFYKLFAAGSGGAAGLESCYDTKSIDDIKDNEVIDVWIDTKTKLIRTVRLYDDKNQANHLDLGLHYTGGDEYPFVLKLTLKDKQTSGNVDVKMTLNRKTNKVILSADANMIVDNQPIKFTINLTDQPGNDKLNVVKPEGAKPLQEALGGLLAPFQPSLPSVN